MDFGYRFVCIAFLIQLAWAIGIKVLEKLFID